MAKYNQGVKQYEQMQTAIKQYDSALNTLNTQFGSYEKAKEMQNTLTAQYNALPEGDVKTKFQAQLAGISQAVAGYEKLNASAGQMAQMKSQSSTIKKQLDQAKEKVASAKPQLDESKKKLDDVKAQIDAMETHLNNGDIYYFIGSMGEDERNKMFESVDKQMKTMGESTMKIAAGEGVKAEYKKLGADINKVQNQYIAHKGIQMLAIALLGAVASICVAFLASKLGASVARDLRLAVFKKVESFSNTEFNKFSTASLITRSTNDIVQIQMVLVIIVRMCMLAPINGIGGIMKAVKNSPSMTWMIFLVVIIIFGVLGVTFSIAMPKFKIIQQLIDKLNLAMRENLSGVLVIRAFGNEEESEKRFDQANKDLTGTNLFVNRVMVSLMPIMMFIMQGMTLLIIYFGAKQVDLGHIAIGEMMAFLQYAMIIVMSFLMVAMIAVMLPRASVAANRVAEVLNTEPTIENPEQSTSFDEDKKGLIEFKHVSFKYPGADEPVLTDIDFTARPGQTTAFIGSTGSGKSTLINLIPRFYDVTEGEVTVDGVDVRHVSMHDLRDRIGVVPQKGLLFSGTIESNIKYGAPDLSDEELAEVIDVAQAKEFIETKPLGVKEPISQGGTNVSGGQKQRLAIARALAKNPKILIFDDSFSALDFKTDATLRKRLGEMTAKTHNTVLIVGQRIASIMHADQIIVLDEGKIVGKGTHEQLMKTCSVYQEIALSQLSKEELDNE
ncbi:ATP-binding cassette domain-containing protein [Catenibacterium sp. NSJ-22]|uniref:ATP-binding cassette domain-containing protein n=4 Tax=Catenibacterium TaxID=135858 RepID=A0ABR7K9N9_9FIRM|nr:ATP-binding cassette domain-containing protein [Catenibacterium faecis]MBD9121935.1 ATP-binding cassette domain-containing protein [Catenibacterium mitsuokai]